MIILIIPYGTIKWWMCQGYVTIIINYKITITMPHDREIVLVTPLNTYMSVLYEQHNIQSDSPRLLDSIMYNSTDVSDNFIDF